MAAKLRDEGKEMSNERDEAIKWAKSFVLQYSKQGTVTEWVCIADAFLAECERADKFERIADKALEIADSKAKVVEQLIAERAKCAVLVEMLEEISKKEGMTLLHDCCVNNSCREVPGEARCTHQLGVNRGFNECANMARTALAKVRGEK